MEYPKKEDALTSQELSRILDIHAAIGNAEWIADLVMPAYWVRKTRDQRPEDHWYLSKYDQQWQEMSEAGIAAPVTDDPRKDSSAELFGIMLGDLAPHAIFATRDEAFNLVSTERAKDLVGNVEEAVATYLKITEASSQANADFLLSLVGAEMTPHGTLLFKPVSEKRLEAVHNLIPMMSAVMRDFVRVNMPVVKDIYPEWSQAIEETPIEDSRNESALTVRKFLDIIANG